MKTKFDVCMGYLLKEAEVPPTEVPVQPEEPYKKKNPYLEGAKVLGSSLAGFGLGQLAGAGIGKGIEYVTHRQGGDPVHVAAKVAPIVGTAAGFIYPLWRAREQQEITDAIEGARDENERRLPR
jgi:hypothetical protein